MSLLKNYLELSQVSKMLHEGRKGKGAGPCPKIWVFSCLVGSDSLKNTARVQPIIIWLYSYGMSHLCWQVHLGQKTFGRATGAPLGVARQGLGDSRPPLPLPLFSSFSMAPLTCLQIPPGIPRMLQLLRDQHSSSKAAVFSLKPLEDTLLCPISWKSSSRP